MTPESLRPLFHDLLAVIGGSADAPLCCGIDAASVARWAADRHMAAREPGVAGKLTLLMKVAIRPEEIPDLSVFVSRLHAALAATHADATAVLALSLEGWTASEIAERRSLGTRLVQRILDDVRREMAGREDARKETTA